jgi:hypothetical protein
MQSNLIEAFFRGRLINKMLAFRLFMHITNSTGKIMVIHANMPSQLSIAKSMAEERYVNETIASGH